MHDQFYNTGKELNSLYPEPDIPAAEGWLVMREMLNTYGPASPDYTVYKKNKLQRPALLLALLLLLVSILISPGEIKKESVTATTLHPIPSMHSRPGSWITNPITEIKQKVLVPQRIITIDAIPVKQITTSPILHTIAPAIPFAPGTPSAENSSSVSIGTKYKSIPPRQAAANTRSDNDETHQKDSSPSNTEKKEPLIELVSTPDLPQTNAEKERNDFFSNESLDSPFVAAIKSVGGKRFSPESNAVLANKASHRVMVGVPLADTGMQRLLYQSIPGDVNTVVPHKTISLTKKTAHKINLGLQWNIPLPNPGAHKYFTGTNGKPKPYTPLLPEIWIKKGFGKKSVSGIQLGINPFQQNPNTDLDILLVQEPLSVQNPLIVLRVTKILKTVGPGITLQYVHNLSTRWSAGAGINYYFPVKALKQVETFELATNNLVERTFSSTKAGSRDSIWTYIKTKPLSYCFTLSYRVKKLQLGTTIFIPQERLNKIDFTKSAPPVNGQFFIRWRIN